MTQDELDALPEDGTFGMLEERAGKMMKAKTREEICSLCAGRGFEQTMTLSVVICRQCHGLGYVVRLNNTDISASKVRAERPS